MSDKKDHNDKIVSTEMADVLNERFTRYAYMSLEDRALPDARDGLKPSQRRVLVAMNDLKLSPGGATKKSAKIAGDCFVAGTLVSTENGLVPIELISIGDKVHTQTGLKKVIQSFSKPAKPLLRIELADGRHLDCTPEQKFKLLKPDLSIKWEKADNLSPGDYLFSARNKNNNTKNNNKKEDYAYMLGYFLADGWLVHDKDRSTPRIGFADEDINVLNHIAAIIKKHFNYTPNIYPVKNSKCFAMRISKNSVNKKMLDKLHIPYNKKASNITIPQWILQSSQKNVWSFISGYLDGDGTVSSKASIISAFSISERFIRDFQTLLLNQGICSSIRKAKKKYISYSKDRLIIPSVLGWHLEIYGSSVRLLGKHLDLHNIKRQKRLAEHCSKRKFFGQDFDVIPYVWNHILSEFKTKHKGGGGWYSNEVGDNVRCGLKYATGTKIRYSSSIEELRFTLDIAERLNILQKLEIIGEEKCLIFLNQVKNQNIQFAKIKSICSIPPQPTFDIEVEDDHELIVNGIVAHNCSGNYHPHGEAVIYPTMCRLIQDWVMRVPLGIGQGNFGSMDDDPPAAMRYTEAKLSHAGMALLEDISPDVVPFEPNYNEELMEPKVLPGKFPNLLVNGCSGIAVGWATNMPTHNLTEVVGCIEAYIKNPNVTEEQLIKIMPGPDFPTGGKLLGQDGVIEYYKTGRGSMLLEGVYHIVKDKKGKESIVITELPYGASPKSLAEDIERLVGDSKNPFEEIDDWKDLSKDKTHVIIGITKGANAQLALNKLLKSSCLRKSVSVNQTVLINGKVVDNTGIKQLLSAFVEHRKIVLTNKYKAELKLQNARLHILEGLINVAQNIDQTIKIIRNAEDPEAATKDLIAAKMVLSIEQAKAVLAITLRQLTKLERNDLIKERDERKVRVVWLEKVLSDIKDILELIIEEQKDLANKFGSERKTQIIGTVSDIANEDLIKNEQVMVSLTGDGYAKQTPLIEYKVQSRGGKGSTGINKKDEGENIFEMFESGSKETVLFFTNLGLMYQKKAYEIPQSQKTGKGIHLSNLLNLKEGEHVTNMISLKNLAQSGFLLTVTKQGLIKRTDITEYDSTLKNAGLTAIKLNDGDQVAFAMITDGKKDICIVTADGNIVRYPESVVKVQGRATRGSRALKLKGSDSVAQVFVLDAAELPDILVVTSNGYGKRSSAEEYRSVQSKGTASGVSVIKKQALAKNGQIVGACSIKEGESFIVLTGKGKIIRMEADDLRSTSRVSQGVRVVKLEEDDTVVKIAKIAEVEDTGLQADVKEFQTT